MVQFVRFGIELAAPHPKMVSQFDDFAFALGASGALLPVVYLALFVGGLATLLWLIKTMWFWV